MHSSAGPTLFDTHGSPVSFVAKSVVLAMGNTVTVSDCAPVALGGEGRGSALHCTASSTASFQLTIQYSFLDAHMRDIGVCPFARECGAQISGILIVDDEHLAALQGNLPVAPVLLLGRDALTVRALETIFGLVLRAGLNRESGNFLALWTHPQQRKMTVPISGTHARRVHMGVEGSTTLPYDTPPADPAEDLSTLSPVLEFLGRDGAPRTSRAWDDGSKGIEAALAAESTAASGDLPGVPRSKEELRARLLQSATSAKLTSDERVYFDHYLSELVDIMWETPRLWGDPSPRGIPLDFQVNEGAPIKGGMHRHPAAECVQPLWNEANRLRGFSFVERVAPGPGGGPPGDGFCVNPIVLAYKHLDPGAAPGTAREIRFCLDMSEFNAKRLKGYMLTHLPDLADYVLSFAKKYIFSNVDMSQAFHQRPVAAELRKYLGFTLIDPATYERTYWQFTCGIFGLQSIPQDFQRCMENLLIAENYSDFLTALRIFIDNIDLSTGLPPGEPDGLPAPASAAGKALAQRHLSALRNVFKRLDAGGFSINVKKSFWLCTRFHSMGLVGDGKGWMISPERLSAWDSFSVPKTPSLKWLRTIIGMFVYAAPTVHLPGSQFTDLMDPLYKLLADALRIKNDAKTDQRLRARAAHAVSDGWTSRHTEAVEMLRDSIKRNSTLAFFDYLLDLALTCDASNAGVCCTASQFDKDTGDWRVVFFVTKRWSANQVKWSIGIRELFGWLVLLRKYRRELRMARCVFRGDHLNLLHVDDLDHLFVQRILTELMEWPDFRNRTHIRGEVNSVADFGSRYADRAPTFLDDAPPGTGESYYYNTPGSSSAVTRRVTLAAGHLDNVALPEPYAGLVVAPHADSVAAAGGGATAPQDTLAVRRVARLDTPGGGLVEHFNHHRPSLSPLFLEIIKQQGAMSEAEKLAHSRLAKASTITLGGHSILLVKGEVYVPPAAVELRNRILATLLHADSTLHCGLEKAELLRRRHGLHIPDFANVFMQFYNSCTCQHARTPKDVRDVGARIPNPRFPPLHSIQMDFASLPTAPSSGGDVNGVCVCIDTASRALVIYPTRDTTCASALAALTHWAARWQYPKVVQADGAQSFGGTEFRAGAAAHGVLVDIGTPLHPQGRGLVEGAVGRFKRAIVSLLPQGSLDQWPTIIDSITAAYMACPQAAMAGYSPFEYLTGIKSDFGSLFEGTHTAQQREDALQAVACIRDIVDFYSELRAVRRAAASPPDPLLPRFTLGEWVLVFNPTLKQNSLTPAYQGPYRIKAVEEDGSGKPTGWFTVAEIMAGDTEVTPREAKPIVLHSNRLWPFDHTRTDADAEHARRLGPQDVIVERIVEGPNLDGKFLVKWRNVPEPRWEWPGGLAHLVLYREYLEEHGMVQGKGGRPIVWAAPSTTGAGAGAAAGAVATRGPAYKVCPICDVEVHQSRTKIEQHLKSRKHILRQQGVDTLLAREAAAAAAAAAAPAILAAASAATAEAAAAAPATAMTTAVLPAPDPVPSAILTAAAAAPAAAAAATLALTAPTAAAPTAGAAGGSVRPSSRASSRSKR